MDGQYIRLVWCINTRTIPRCFGETKMASNNENGIGHLWALVPWLMMMMMMMRQVNVCLTQLEDYVTSQKSRLLFSKDCTELSLCINCKILGWCLAIENFDQNFTE